jgi:uncharacterized membrane protein
MKAAADTDIQQLKDLIIAQQQEMRVGYAQIETKIGEVKNDLTQEMRVGYAQIEAKIGEVKAELSGIKTQLSDIKTDQRGQDNRFFGLLLFFLTVAIGIATKLAKLY